MNIQKYVIKNKKFTFLVFSNKYFFYFDNIASSSAISASNLVVDSPAAAFLDNCLFLKLNLPYACFNFFSRLAAGDEPPPPPPQARRLSLDNSYS